MNRLHAKADYVLDSLRIKELEYLTCVEGIYLVYMNVHYLIVCQPG